MRKKNRIWWSEAESNTLAGVGPVHYGPLMPVGTLITEVQIRSQSAVDVWMATGSVLLRHISTEDVSAQQLADSEQVIPFLDYFGNREWRSFGRDCNDIFPMHKPIVGANQRLAWLCNSLGGAGIIVRVSIQYELR